MELTKELLNFKVTPSVVKADEVSKIQIKGLGDYYRFYDDVTYTITLFPIDVPDCDLDDDFTLGAYQRTSIEATPKNGVLEFEYNFKAEQEWDIQVCASEAQRAHLTVIYRNYPNNWNQVELEKGLHFKIYSLYSDLYERKPLKGDMHVHTNGSDGKENPETVAANYRKMGYDYISINDHHTFVPSVTAKNKMAEIKSGFTVYTGEEVHNKYLGRFHVVSFGAKSSVNDIILANKDEVTKEVESLSEKIDGFSKRECMEVAWYRWICEKIRERDGLCIFVHPYWNVYNVYNCSTKVATEVFRRGYFDAFEALGGTKYIYENNLQSTLYYEMRAEGLKMPIVGSTDSHSSYPDGAYAFRAIYTIAFAKSNDLVKEAVNELYSVAAEELSGDSNARITGPLRLAKYAHFLANNYYPMRDKLCATSGKMMALYFEGDTKAKEIVESIEERISDFEAGFFGHSF